MGSRGGPVFQKKRLKWLFLNNWLQKLFGDLWPRPFGFFGRPLSCGDRLCGQSSVSCPGLFFGGKQRGTSFLEMGLAAVLVDKIARLEQQRQPTTCCIGNSALTQPPSAVFSGTSQDLKISACKRHKKNQLHRSKIRRWGRQRWIQCKHKLVGPFLLTDSV